MFYKHLLVSIATLTFFNEAFDFAHGVIFCKGMFFSKSASAHRVVMIILALLMKRTVAVMHPMEAVIMSEEMSSFCVYTIHLSLQSKLYVSSCLQHHYHTIEMSFY